MRALIKKENVNARRRDCENPHNLNHPHRAHAHTHLRSSPMALLRALAAAAVLACASAKVVSSAAGIKGAPRTQKTSSVRDATATVNVHIVPHTHDDVGE